MGCGGREVVVEDGVGVWGWSHYWVGEGVILVVPISRDSYPIKIFYMHMYIQIWDPNTDQNWTNIIPIL